MLGCPDCRDSPGCIDHPDYSECNDHRGRAGLTGSPEDSGCAEGIGYAGRTDSADFPGYVDPNGPPNGTVAHTAQLLPAAQNYPPVVEAYHTIVTLSNENFYLTLAQSVVCLSSKGTTRQQGRQLQ